MTTTPEREAVSHYAGEDTAAEPAPGGLDGEGPGDSGPGGGRGGDGDPALPVPRDLPRWVRWAIVPLLVLVPLGYVIISAAQSRDSGQDVQKQAAARHLTWVVPSELQRRIYQVPIPDGTVHDGYLETNSWDTSEFYCQFTTSAGGLDTFLAQLGTSRAALHDGKVAISPKQSAQVGWNFDIPHHQWAGMSSHQAGDKPDHDITVDLTHADTPVVYVVSTVNFQHGFGGG
ncbi:hypothetical protein [Actinacidiphila paucisporea]|uniref:Uncharacterized protein n=1 Tax=Actinacidiphila paucisporea TaxID=310782 RepID=A0A1M7K226_9ACTN|nr:hypothetical protein [Actinacidiphila paucisporea]SHM59308.1 hypothetical protein SAMN05216499_112120 [Actinacidiphila paucisporea]